MEAPAAPLLKDTGSHVHGKSGNLSETLLLQKVIYETSNSGNSGDLELSELQGHTCDEGLQNAIFVQLCSS